MLGLALAASTTASLPAALAQEAPRVHALDELTLRDGRRVRGRVLENRPGHWIVIETEDGRQHTFAWDALAEVDLAAAPREADGPQVVRRAWRMRSAGRLQLELRGELTAMALPKQTFGLTGECATGTGSAPASIYGQTASAKGHAVGGGVGGRAAFMYMSPLDPGESSTWWGLRVGTGLDLQMMYSRVPSGIPPIDGELCSTVATTSHEVGYRSSSFLLVQIPVTLGAHWGVGRFDDVMKWRGVVLGAAWSPSWVHVGPWTSAGSGHFNLLGVELTVDFMTLHAASRRSESHFRIAASFAPPFDDSQLMIGTLGLGAVWY